MEAVKEFDRQWKKLNKDNFVFKMVGEVVLGIFLFVVACLPVQDFDGVEILPVFGIMGACEMVSVHLGFYLRVKEEGEMTTGICEKLSFLPVYGKNIFKVREQMLRRDCVIIFALVFCAQYLGRSVEGLFLERGNLFYAAALTVVAYVFGIIYIFSNLTRKK